MLKAGHFATVNLVTYGLERVFVCAVDAHRGEATVISLGKRSSEVILGKKMVTKVIEQTLAPMDLRQWPPEALASLLEAEKHLLATHQQQLARVFVRVNKEGVTPFGTHTEAWERYHNAVENVGVDPNSKITALLERSIFRQQRKLPGRKLNRKTKSKLRAKDKMRRVNARRSAKAVMPYTMEEDKQTRQKGKPPPKPTTAQTLPKKRKTHIVPGNMYKIAPGGWPEVYTQGLIGSVEECFAFSGLCSPVTGTTYKRWRGANKHESNCSHGNLSNCMCLEAIQARYQNWLNVNPGDLEWAYPSREFFMPSPKRVGSAKYPYITPPDWPEGGGGRLGCLGESRALTGGLGIYGLHYREWYANNFYLDFGCGGACKCHSCAIKRYEKWSEE